MADSKKDITDKLIRLFSSLKLAVALLILLALVSVFGTFIPQEQDPSVYIQRYGQDSYTYLKYMGLIDLYHSWGFRLLMSLITANLLVCTVRRLKGVIKRTLEPQTEKTPDAISSLKLHNELPDPGKAAVLERALSDKGYRVKKRGRFIYGGRGVIGIWGDMVTHFSILLVILGALAGSAGFVSTVNVYVNGWTDTAYNWSAGRDEPLGFRLAVDNFNVKYYPIRIKLSVLQVSTGNKVGEFEVGEGAKMRIPGTSLEVSPVRVDVPRREALLKIYNNGRLYGLYDTSLPSGGPPAPIGMDYVLFVDGVATPVVMSIVSTVNIAREDATVKRGIIEVNKPFRFEGLSIYQTAYGVDPDGRSYTGFQIVRDPGIPLVWAGFSLLLVGLYISFFYSHRQVWVFVGEDKISMGGSTNKNWSGFMTEYGGLVKSFMQELEH